MSQINTKKFFRWLGLGLIALVPMVSLWSGTFVNSVRANSTGISALGTGATDAFGDPAGETPRVILVPEEAPTIQGAIDQAVDGSVIFVGPGEYRENLSMRGKKFLMWAVAGADQTSIVGDGREGPIASIEDSKVTIEGFTFENGRGETGRGAALTRSGGTFTNCRFMNNKGGLSAADSQVQFENCQIIDNRSAVEGGGVWALRSDVRLSDCEVNRNAAGTFGGGVYASNGSMQLLNVDLLDNRVVSGAWGGGLYASGGNLEVSDCSIAGNSSNESGAGIYAFGVVAKIRGTYFEKNVAESAWNVDGEQTIFDIQDSPLENEGESLTAVTGESTAVALAAAK